MAREKLDDRRPNFTQAITCMGDGGKEFKILVTFGHDHKRVREVFCADFKAGTERHTLVTDASILLSRLLQHGDLPSNLLAALCTPPSFVGTIVAAIIELDKILASGGIPESEQTIIRIAWEWACRVWGEAHMQNLPLRGLRAAEEIVELCQALDVPKEKMRLLVEEVYARPKGDVDKEIPQVVFTVHMLCASYGSDPEERFTGELLRLLAKDPEVFRKRNQQKLDAGLII